MVLFSEYLIEKKKVSPEQMAAAFIEQIRTIPSLAEIIYEKQLFTNNELLQILSYQQKNALDFCKSAQELGLWTDKILTQVNEQIESVKTPLAEILLKKGILSLDDLNSIFTLYVEDSKRHIAENLSQNKKLDSIVPNEYLATCENTNLPNIENNILLLENMISLSESPLVIKEKFQVLMKNMLVEFVEIRAEAQSIRAKQTVNIIEATIKFLEVFESTNLPIEITSVVHILKSSHRILTVICQYLKDFKGGCA